MFAEVVVLPILFGTGAAASAALTAVAVNGAPHLVFGLAQAEPLGVRLVELGRVIIVALHVAVAGGRRGVDGAFALLETAGGYLGGVPFVSDGVISRLGTFSLIGRLRSYLLSVLAERVAECE